MTSKPLSQLEQRVLDVFDDGEERSAREAAADAELGLGRVLPILTRLEEEHGVLSGRLERMPGATFHRRLYRKVPHV